MITPLNILRRLTLAAACLTVGAAASGQTCGYTAAEPVSAAYDAPKAGNGSMDYCWYFGTSNPRVLRAGNGYDRETSAAFMIPGEVVATLNGNTITSVKMTSGANMSYTSENHVIDVTVWLARDLYDEPVAVQHGRLSRTALKQAEIVFDEPWPITGDEPLYIGATVVMPTAKDCPWVTDRTPSANGTGFWVQRWENDELLGWEDWSGTYGSLMMSATVTGTNLPHNDCALVEMRHPDQVVPGRPFEMPITICNRGADSVTSVEFALKLGKGSTEYLTVPLDKPMTFNTRMTVTFTVICRDQGTDIPLEASVSKVNGEPDTNPSDNSARGLLLCISPEDGFQRVMVMEEGTGTWCGNCPRGLVSMQYMLEKYPETFIGIAIHQNDPMQIAGDYSYSPHLKRGWGYPNAMYNRDEDRYGTSLPYHNGVEEIYKDMMLRPAIAAVSQEVGRYDDETVAVKTECRFAFDNENKYGLAFVLVENGVGPYSQSNFYQGYKGSIPQWDIWSNGSDNVSILFDHVARYIDSYYGIEGSLPAKVSKGQTYEFVRHVPLDRLDSEDNYGIVTLLINRTTGKVENAAYTHCDANLPDLKLEQSALYDAVECTVADTEQAEPEYYDLRGVRVQADRLTPGLYIERRGTATRKVRIR